jgi:anti-sigma B factor antagonist
MELNINRTENRMVVAPKGRLDTMTAPELDSLVRSSLDGITELFFDMKKLEYISSAGLRVLLTAQKSMNGKGSMVITGCSSDILEIFDITGFSEILTIREE